MIEKTDHNKNLLGEYIGLTTLGSTCTIQSTPGMSSPLAATSVHSRIPLESAVYDANAFSLAIFREKHRLLNPKHT